MPIAPRELSRRAEVRQRTAQRPRALVRHDDLDWHVHAVADSAPLERRVVVESAMAMIDLIRADELARLSTCADPDCGGLVLDLSRNRSRRYCSTACANRSAVAAYRARSRASVGPAGEAAGELGKPAPEAPRKLGAPRPVS